MKTSVSSLPSQIKTSQPELFAGNSTSTGISCTETFHQKVDARPKNVKNVLRRMIFKPLLLLRAKRLYPMIIDSLPNCSTLMDLGCGDMILTEFLSKYSPFDVTPVDTIDSNLSHLSVNLYDGVTLPFSDNNFDATMVAYMLHHCNDIPAVLSEIKRVTSKKIIVMEEIYNGKVTEKILHLHDSGNKFLSTKMHIPCNFLKIDDWFNTFESIGLHVEHTRRIFQYPLINLTHQVLFELRVK